MKLGGLDLDEVYENLAWQISSGRLGTNGDIEEALSHYKQRQKLEGDIVALEKKLLCEKQFKKQVMLNGVLNQIRKELEELG